MATKSDRITPKQQKFIETYLVTGNATQAAKEAYNCNNAVTAGAVGSENLQKPQIVDAMTDISADIKLSAKQALGNGLDRAIALSLADLNSDDPALVRDAKRYLLDVAKFIGATGNYTDARKLSFTLPKK